MHHKTRRPRALRELVSVLVAWITGQGDLPGLLIAWLQVISGQIPVDDDPADDFATVALRGYHHIVNGRRT